MNSEKLIKDLKKGTVETQGSRLKNKADSGRWKIAQVSEKEYWDGYSTESLLKESKDRYPKKAKVLERVWSDYINLDKKMRILQVGCGPEDVINYLEIGKNYSIDPLADYYQKHFNIDYKKSNLKKGRGEEIPFPDKFFDIVILINVLDHTQLPDKVLSEISRVLKDEGIFHFENYMYQKRFIRIARFWGTIKERFTKEIFNIHHPYMFTLIDLRALIAKNFSTINEEIGKDIGLYNTLDELKEESKKNKKISRRILAYFGLLGLINYMCICRKKIILRP
jgi:ubiquinone/menaquinone biosynthesis C-methylase UbiE